MLEQEELSDKFVIMEDNNNDMSESLGIYNRIILFLSHIHTSIIFIYNLYS